MDDTVRTLPHAADVALAATLLLVLMPLMLVIALAIALSEGRPILFGQIRLGQHRQPFVMRKFRTLEIGRIESESVTPQGSSKMTRLGAWLRHTRLDELPQLYDVLTGRMALVGPRPETPANLEAVEPDELDRWLAVRPGLTGATQLAFIAEDAVLAHAIDATASYRKLLVPAKVRHGIAQMRTRSASADLAVLLRTPIVLASRRARARSRRHVEALLGGQEHAGVASVRSSRPG